MAVHGGDRGEFPLAGVHLRRPGRDLAAGTGDARPSSMTTPLTGADLWAQRRAATRRCAVCDSGPERNARLRCASISPLLNLTGDQRAVTLGDGSRPPADTDRPSARA